MSRNKPDIATLDALVLGTDGSEDRAAWEWLVATPGSARVWAEAAARRTELDHFAETLDAHPWIAHVMERVRQLGGLLTSARIEVTLGQESLLTSLGPAEEEPAVLASPPWGRIEPVSVRIGTIAGLRVTGTAPGKTRIFYRLPSGAEGPLPQGRWRLEPGEAPVLLVACTGGAEASTLDEALSAGASVAGVLLMEEPAEE